MMVRKDLPYLMLSLAAHAGLLALLLLWRLPPEPEPRARRVLIEFGRPAGGLSPAAAPAARPKRELPGMRIPAGQPLAIPPVPGTPAGGSKAVPLPEAPRRLPGAPPRISEVTGAAALPTPAQVLRGLAAPGKRPDAMSDSRAATPAEGPPIATAAESAEGAPTAGYTQATALEWKDGERTLLMPPRLRFPELLLEKGLEVDVEAAFSVAPSGQVIRVQITRSSGFASVDRQVEQALQNALFAESSREDSGRIQFRFRLERKE